LTGASFDEGQLIFAAVFSEDLVQTSSAFKGPFTPSTDDVVLVNQLNGMELIPASVGYSPGSDELTVIYDFIPEGQYSLALVSGDNALEDLIGHDLDGEALGASLDGAPTGDGVAGGDYVIQFDVDRAAAEAVPFERLEPLGGFTFGSQGNTGLVNFAGDEDDFTFTMQLGETVAARLVPTDVNATLSIQLLGETGILTASGPGETVVLPATSIAADGGYAIRVAGDQVTTFSLDIFRNATLEDEVGDSSDGNEVTANPLSLGLGSGTFGILGTSFLPTVELDAVVWGVQPDQGRIIKVDPNGGHIVDTFSAPGTLLPTHTNIGLSIAEDGASLIYINADDDADTLYRLDPQTGEILSTETPAFAPGSTYDGLSSHSVPASTTLFSQDFESGLSANEVVSGIFSVNNFNSVLNNGTMMLGHSFNYTNNDYSYYEVTLDLTGVTTAELSFDYVAEIEDEFDGVNVQASASALNPPGDLIVPISGLTYDETRPIQFLGTTAYDGDGVLDSGTATFDLTSLVGGTAHVRIQFQSDESVSRAGFKFDNVLVTAALPDLPIIYSSNPTAGVDRQQGFSGTEFVHLDDATLALNPTGGLGGDSTGRQFGFFSDGLIYEFDPLLPDTLMNSFAPPALDVEGLAFDGTNLYVSSASGSLYTLNPDTGSELNEVVLADGPLFGLGAIRATQLVANELIVNGGFEAGTLTGWKAGDNGLDPTSLWSVAGDGGGFSGDSAPLSGDHSAFNGFEGGAGLEYELFQDVSIPNVNVATLTTNHRLQFDSLGVVSTQDRTLEISVRDSNNTVLELLYTETLTLNGQSYTDLGWNTQTFDLSAYAGQDVRVHFRESIPEATSGPALLQFDDISLKVPGVTVVVPEVDEYEFTLSGLIGQSMDIIFAGHDGADFDDAQLELLDGAGSVLATASPNPLGNPEPGGQPTNYDLGILDFSIPADDTYTLRFSSVSHGEYGIFVAGSLTVESEPNNALITELRSLNLTHAAVGFLGTAGVGNRLFGIDPSTNEVVEYDPASGAELNRLVLPVSTDGLADALAFDGTSLYYASGVTGVLYELDPDDGSVLDNDAFTALGLSAGVDGLGAYAGHLVASDPSTGELFFVDALVDAVVGSLSPMVSFAGGAAGAGSRGSIFVSDALTGQIHELAAATGDLWNTITVPAMDIAGLAFINEALFVADARTGSLLQVDPNTGALLNGFVVGVNLSGLGGDNALGILPLFSSAPVNPSEEGPTVNSVSPLVGPLVDVNITSITLEFSEQVTVNSADESSNYQLLDAGPNGLFEDGGGDDVVIAVTPSLDAGQTVVTLAIEQAFSPLPAGKFQLKIDGESSIVDLVGNPLNSITGLDGGMEFVHQFSVVSSFSEAGDVYRLDLVAGQNVIVRTATPLDVDLDPSNNQLDPALLVYDPAGSPIAGDRDSFDGKNAITTFTAETDGAFVIQIFGQSGFGEYFLDLVVDGDFDRNGTHDCLDVDAFVNEIVAGTNNLLFDMTGDGLVDDADLNVWLDVAATANGFASPYPPGDANLDGNVDGVDFGIWFQNRFTLNASWCSGDFNANGEIDVRDLNRWNENRFTVSNVSGDSSTPSASTPSASTPSAAGSSRTPRSAFLPPAASDPPLLTVNLIPRAAASVNSSALVPETRWSGSTPSDRSADDSVAEAVGFEYGIARTSSGSARSLAVIDSAFELSENDELDWMSAGIDDHSELAEDGFGDGIFLQ